MEASDNGYDGAGGIQTGSFSIQVAVAGVNDAPVVVRPPSGRAVPGEIEAFPGFFVLDPDTDTDGKIAEGMIKVCPSKARILLYFVLQYGRAYTEGTQTFGRKVVAFVGVHGLRLHSCVAAPLEPESIPTVLFEERRKPATLLPLFKLLELFNLLVMPQRRQVQPLVLF